MSGGGLSLLADLTRRDRATLRARESTTFRTGAITRSQHVYEVRSRLDHREVDLISDVLPFGRLWYSESNATSNAIGDAIHYSRSHDAVIRVYDDGGNMIETHEHKDGFKEW
jgi:hypothetical protein